MDPEIGRLPVIHYSTSTSDLSGDHLSQESSSSSSSPSKGFSKREILACFIIIIQGLALLVSLQQLARAGVASQFSSYSEAKLHTWMSVNGKPSIYHEKYFLEASKNKDSTTPFFDPPTHYPADAGLVSRVWHSNGSPAINSGLQKGSCWCSGDDYCMCTPSLAIDMILTSGPDHIWMVQRATGGLMALMGGFNEVGETVEEAARREMKEEMNLDLPGQEIRLFGVYSDPKRDQRKHAVSVVFLMDVPADVVPVAGDDASSLHRVPLDAIDGIDMFIDHKTVLRDYLLMRNRQMSHSDINSTPQQISAGTEPFKRSTCSTL
jgi:8-oxo-dGTP diphosphatase